MNVGVLGIGRYESDKVLTNQDLEKMVDTSDEWITTRTGIKERRLAPDHIDSSDMALESAEEAIRDAGMTADDIDMILVATVTPDTTFPSVACMIQDRLGAPHVPCMDMGAACAGFMYGMVTAKQFIDNGVHENILVVGVEKLSKIVDWEDRSTAVLFGDGAGAVVMGPVSDDKGILSFELGADGSGGKYLYKDDYMRMNGREVFKFAVRQMGETAEQVIADAGLSPDDVDYLVPHQANIRIMEASRQRLDLPEEKMIVTVDKYGNTSSSSIPIALMEQIKAGGINDGDVIVMIGFGGGLTWGGIALRWGE